MRKNQFTVKDLDTMEITEEHAFSNHYLREKKRIISEVPDVDRRGKVIMITAAAVSVAAAAFVITGFLAGWFGHRKYTVTLANGDTVTYRNDASTAGASDLVFDCPTTPAQLSEDAIRTIFPEGITPDRAFAQFRTDTGELIHLEAAFEADNALPEMSIHFDIDKGRVTDTGVGANETASVINGVSVNAGYYITDANSRGEKRALADNTFPVGKIYAYVCTGGDAEDAEAVCKRAAEVTEKLISNGDSGFLSVKLDEKNTVSASKDKGDSGTSEDRRKPVETTLKENKTYEYSGNVFDEKQYIGFVITLFTDGRYSYNESPISSYFGVGTYEISADGILTMTEDAEMGHPGMKNRFRFEGDRLIFIREGSTNFGMVKVKDGEAFYEVHMEGQAQELADPEVYEGLIPQVGASLKLLNATAEGCRAVFSYEPVRANGEMGIVTVEHWLLCKIDDDGNRGILCSNPEDTASERIHDIAVGKDTLELDANWAKEYGALPPGKYSISFFITTEKPIGGNNGYTEFSLACSFVIE